MDIWHNVPRGSCTNGLDKIQRMSHYISQSVGKVLGSFKSDASGECYKNWVEIPKFWTHLNPQLNFCTSLSLSVLCSFSLGILLCFSCLWVVVG